jgi:hypothetical protein
MDANYSKNSDIEEIGSAREMGMGRNYTEIKDIHEKNNNLTKKYA